MVLLLFPISTCFADSNPKIHHKKWPASQACNACIPLQIGYVQYSLPANDIKTIHVLHMDGANVHVSFSNNYSGTADHLSFAALTEPYRKGGTIRKLYAKLGIQTNLELFQMLAQPTENETHKRLKDAYHVSQANRYITYEGNQAFAFWVNGKTEQESALYIVPNDVDKFVYMVNGKLNEQLVLNLLRHTKMK